MDEKYRFVNLAPDSVELRAFVGADAESGEVTAYNVWRSAIVPVGRPPTHILLCVLFHGEPDEGEGLNLSFSLSQARAVHQMLTETLDSLPE